MKKDREKRESTEERVSCFPPKRIKKKLSLVAVVSSRSSSKQFLLFSFSLFFLGFSLALNCNPLLLFFTIIAVVSGFFLPVILHLLVYLSVLFSLRNPFINPPSLHFPPSLYSFSFSLRPISDSLTATLIRRSYLF